MLDTYLLDVSQANLKIFNSSCFFKNIIPVRPLPNQEQIHNWTLTLYLVLYKILEA